MRALFVRAVPAFLVLPLLAAPGAAQERCKWSSDSDPGNVTSYPQQLNIDVGDAPGHIVGAYELHTVSGPNSKPNCEGLKDKETWTHGYRDYRDRNGHTWGYMVTTLENGDKIYSEYSGVTRTTVAADGSTKTGRHIGIVGDDTSAAGPIESHRRICWQRHQPAVHIVDSEPATVVKRDRNLWVGGHPAARTLGPQGLRQSSC
jgi:hypothetical protein